MIKTSKRVRIGLKLLWMWILVVALILMASTKLDFVYRAF